VGALQGRDMRVTGINQIVAADHGGIIDGQAVYCFSFHDDPSF